MSCKWQAQSAMLLTTREQVQCLPWPHGPLPSTFVWAACQIVPRRSKRLLQETRELHNRFLSRFGLLAFKFWVGLSLQPRSYKMGISVLGCITCAITTFLSASMFWNSLRNQTYISSKCFLQSSWTWNTRSIITFQLYTVCACRLADFCLCGARIQHLKRRRFQSFKSYH